MRLVSGGPRQAAAMPMSSQCKMWICKVPKGTVLCTETLIYETERPKVDYFWFALNSKNFQSI